MRTRRASDQWHTYPPVLRINFSAKTLSDFKLNGCDIEFSYMNIDVIHTVLHFNVQRVKKPWGMIDSVLQALM